MSGIGDYSPEDTTYRGFYDTARELLYNPMTEVMERTAVFDSATLLMKLETEVVPTDESIWRVSDKGCTFGSRENNTRANDPARRSQKHRAVYLTTAKL